MSSALLATALGVGGCQSEPDTVLQSDLPQVPGMTPRDSVELKQSGDRVIGGQFYYKGEVSELAARVDETKSRFQAQGWRATSETITGSAAVLTFAKDERLARVEILRNGVQPKMSTAVMRVDLGAAALPSPSEPKN